MKKISEMIANHREEVHASYCEGYQCGLNWPSNWDHRPGGPWIFKAYSNDSEEIKQFAKLSSDKNKAWLNGWDAAREKIGKA